MEGGLMYRGGGGLYIFPRVDLICLFFSPLDRSFVFLCVSLLCFLVLLVIVFDLVFLFVSFAAFFFRFIFFSDEARQTASRASDVYTSFHNLSFYPLPPPSPLARPSSNHKIKVHIFGNSIYLFPAAVM